MLKTIEKPEIETVELKTDGKYGKFVLSPLERGYGITLGNSLRRVLLSSLPGVAVSAVKIEGVHHELSTIPGVKEDVTEIILAIKGLTVKLQGDGPKQIYIEAQGECEVTAGDIKADSEVTILDPGMHIATLMKGAKLDMQITIDKGRGYVSAERNKQQFPPQTPLETIAVDSIYTPVLKVNYKVRIHVLVRLLTTISSRWKSGQTAQSLRKRRCPRPPISSTSISNSSSICPKSPQFRRFWLKRTMAERRKSWR